MPLLRFENNGQELLSTNFWTSEENYRGVFLAVINAGAVRLLVPNPHRALVPEMRTGTEVIISKGAYQGETAYEFLFDDHTDDPFHLLLSAHQMVPGGIVDTEHGRDDITVSVWVSDRQAPKKVLELPGRFRVVETLPCLRAWGETP